MSLFTRLINAIRRRLEDRVPEGSYQQQLRQVWSQPVIRHAPDLTVRVRAERIH